MRGLDVEIVKKFAKLAGLKVTFVEVKDFDGIWDLPAKGVCDVSIGGIGITEARTRRKTAWTIPYFYVKRTLIYNKKWPIKQFSDIAAEVRGTVGSTGWIDAQDRMDVHHRLKYLKPGHTDEQDIADLLSGKIVGLMRGSFVGVALCRRFPEQLAMWEPWEMDPKLVSSDGECFAFPTNKRSSVAVALSSFITALLLGGKLQRLVTKYQLE